MLERNIDIPGRIWTMFSTDKIFHTVKAARFTALSLLVCLLTLGLSANVLAEDLELSFFGGKMYSSDLSFESDKLSVDSGGNLGFAIAWQETPNGQGQILFNTVSHNFESIENQQTESFNVSYLHFNGVAQFRQQDYVTTVSLGAGGTYFDTHDGETWAPSITAALGTRYEISKNLAIITDARIYASLTEEDDDIFCTNDGCNTQFDGAVWIETSISIGIAYRF